MTETTNNTRNIHKIRWTMNFATSTPYEPRIDVADEARRIPPSSYEIRDLQKVVFVIGNKNELEMALPAVSNLLNL